MWFLFKNNNIKQRIDKFISKKINFYTRNKIKKIIKVKGIYINNKLIYKPSFKIKTHEKIKINIIEQNNKYVPNKYIPLNKIYEDNYILIINKKQGIVVHPRS